MTPPHRHLEWECYRIRTLTSSFGVAEGKSVALVMASVALVGVYHDMNANCRRSWWTESAGCPVGHRTLGRQVSNLRAIRMLVEGDESFRSSILAQQAWA